MHFNFLPILDYLPQTSLKVIFGYCGSSFLPANSKLHLLYVYVIIFSATILWALNVLSFSLALWHLWLQLFTTGHLRTLGSLGNCIFTSSALTLYTITHFYFFSKPILAIFENLVQPLDAHDQKSYIRAWTLRLAPECFLSQIWRGQGIKLEGGTVTSRLPSLLRLCLSNSILSLSSGEH